MLNIDTYNQKGEKVGKIDLPENIFGLKLNPDLIQQAYVAQKASSRVATAHTKTRGEVSGGGAKPWKQKGTGRARHGSNRSPIWIGGGVTFGPRNDRNFSKKINKKQKQRALFMVLSSKINDKEFVALDNISFGEVKTKKAKELVDIVSKNILGKDRAVKILFVLPEKDSDVQLSLRNIPRVKVIFASSLNVGDLLDYKYTVFAKDAIKVVENTYTKITK